METDKEIKLSKACKIFIQPMTVRRELLEPKVLDLSSGKFATDINWAPLCEDLSSSLKCHLVNWDKSGAGKTISLIFRPVKCTRVFKLTFKLAEVGSSDAVMVKLYSNAMNCPCDQQDIVKYSSSLKEKALKKAERNEKKLKTKNLTEESTERGASDDSGIGKIQNISATALNKDEVATGNESSIAIEEDYAELEISNILGSPNAANNLFEEIENLDTNNIDKIDNVDFLKFLETNIPPFKVASIEDEAENIGNGTNKFASHDGLSNELSQKEASQIDNATIEPIVSVSDQKLNIENQNFYLKEKGTENIIEKPARIRRKCRMEQTKQVFYNKKK